MDRYVSIGEAARALGVSITTLRRWEATGKRIPEHTAGGLRRSDCATLTPERFRAETDSHRRAVAYAHGSSRDQKPATTSKDDRARQPRVLERSCASQGRTVERVTDPGSGRNDRTNGVKQRLHAIIDGQAGRPVIARVGAEVVVARCDAANVEVVSLTQGKDTTVEEDVARGALEIITVFSARRYGSRSRANQKAPESMKNAVDEAQA